MFYIKLLIQALGIIILSLTIGLGTVWILGSFI
jgi:hypothetical protein